MEQHKSSATGVSPPGTTRRQLVKGAVGVGVTAAATGLLAGPAQAAPGGRPAGRVAMSAEPKPLPFTNNPGVGNIMIHAFAPVRGAEHVDITDFNGYVGLANVTGTGTRTNLRTGAQERLPYTVDLRFFTGDYVGIDGRVHTGTFSHI